jgi:glucose-1-phosphate cytidylyltransferase
LKVVIFAGGFGTRFAEETTARPKPMIEIGDMPILWHIMKVYSAQGFNEFVICLGYKSSYVKEWFNNYYLHKSDVTFNLCGGNEIVNHKNVCEPWKVTLVDTGLETMTSGRLARIKEHVKGETFMLTYGDGLSDVNLKKLLDFHKSHGKTATVTTIIPEGRFGIVKAGADGKVDFFGEKVDNHDRVNGGFFVVEPKIFDYVTKDGKPMDEIPFEQKPLENLTKDGELYAYEHNGFWKPMDALRDKIKLEEMWASGKAPWKIWED